MSVRIEQHRLGGDIRPFLDVPHRVFGGDPAWVPPLELEIKERLSPSRNPFFEHAEGTAFTAWRDGQPVGRITAQIDREHLRIHRDETGFFGFFDTVDDAEVAAELLGAAEGWLRARGMKRVRGPMSLSINEEVGVLVDGFEHPPFILMPQSRPWQGSLAEAAGYVKEKDLFAWRYESGNMPPRAVRAWEEVRALPEVRFRSVDRGDMRREVELMLEIFNDAWSENWGFVPATQAEAEKMASDLRMLIDPALAFFAEVKGRPMGVCVCLPNVNEVIRDLGGKLLPFGFLKLLYRLKVRKPSSARVMLLGIRQELRGVKRYGGLSTAMYVELSTRGPKHGYTWGELGWTLEDNRPVNLGIRAMGGQVWKTYRVYHKALGGES